jgi:hypothetical protein
MPLDGLGGPSRSDDQRTLRSKQSLLVQCLGKFIAYAYERGYELTLGEGYIQTPRRERGGQWMQDGVHMPSSLHYSRLAIDINLFVRGEYITDSQNFAWVDLGNFWEGLDPACCWGGHWHDGNHLSVTWGGRK